MSAAIAAMRALYGRSDVECIAEIQNAAQRLSIATRSWSTVEPKRAQVDDALSTAHGLQRALSDLHSRLKSVNVG